MIIPKNQLTERLQPGSPHADIVRRIIEGAYQIGEQVTSQRRDLSSARAGAKEREQLKDAVKREYLPRLAELAAPLKAMREEYQADRSSPDGRVMAPSKRGEALYENLAMADAALWAAKQVLAPAAGLSIHQVDWAMGLT